MLLFRGTANWLHVEDDLKFRKKIYFKRKCRESEAKIYIWSQNHNVCFLPQIAVHFQSSAGGRFNLVLGRVTRDFLLSSVALAR